MWLYKGEEFKTNMILSHVGFVYKIQNLLDSRAYIGKKLFWFSRIKIVKGKRKRVKEESDWQIYYGSCLELQNDVAHFGSHNFSREILHLCDSKGVMSYLEMKEQIINDVLLKPLEFYNSFVGGKIHRKHIIGKME